MTTTIQGVIAADTAHTEPYLTLPFVVTEGTTRIDVRYRYDDGHILDIGLLDPSIAAFPSPAGFRGWSGSARSHVYVARDGATPGYIAGDIPPGTWQVVLGLAHIGPEPCHYRVDIDLDDVPRRMPEVPAPSPVVVAGAGWYKGDLHSHTHYSDARGSLEDLVAAAKTQGLDFLAVTDHNTVGHHLPTRIASGTELLLFPGEEITTYRGHANVWGVSGWVDFRITEPGHVDTLARHVHDRGGLFAVNHPRTAPNCIGCDWEFPVPLGVDCFEAWNGPWGYRNWEALERYDDLLRRGGRPTLVGGSDRHQPGWPDDDPGVLWVGSPTTWLYLDELSEASILTVLAGGNAFVSESPLGPRLELRVDGAAMGSAVSVPPGHVVDVRGTVHGAPGARIRYLSAEGIVRETPVTDDPFIDAWRWMPEGPFLRLEVLAQGDEPHLTELFAALGARHKSPPA